MRKFMRWASSSVSLKRAMRSWISRAALTAVTAEPNSASMAPPALGGFDGRTPDLDLRRLRLHLSGNAYSSRQLYLPLCRHLDAITLQPLDAAGQPLTQQPSLTLPADHLQPCGFATEETLLPDTDQGFSGYRHLQDYFAFAEKFLFVELSGLEREVTPDKPLTAC